MSAGHASTAVAAIWAVVLHSSAGAELPPSARAHDSVLLQTRGRGSRHFAREDAVLSSEGSLSAVRNCYLAPLVPGAGCTLTNTLRGQTFDLNEFGQETTGKRACLEHMRRENGNAFVFTPGECQLWSCTDREALRASAGGAYDPAPAQPMRARVQVFSELCGYQEPMGGRRGEARRAPVFVKLWEWNYADVARECQEYLGPNGIDAVQLSPVVEHKRGYQWWTKYQPVSFSLNTRSGTERDFRDMVAACRAAGVEVIVDAVLNHVAKCTKEEGCVGWAGSKYSFRRLNGSEQGWDAAEPENFNHLPGRPMDRLCQVGPTVWTCGGSHDIGDGSCNRCDMYGMPDWNFTQDAVRAKIFQHLRQLHDLGVTMLRLDAALYMDERELGGLLNHFPWDDVFQEWWGEVPREERTNLVGHQRDIKYSELVGHALLEAPAAQLSQLLSVQRGVPQIPPEHAVYPVMIHDQRDDSHQTYKMGLSYHLKQKYMLANPFGVSLVLWSGFGWSDTQQGPPGCEKGDDLCSPTPVFDAQGRPSCMPTPSTSPLQQQEAGRHAWVCEHRWEGVAGLVGFRKACRGLPIQETWAAGSQPGVEEGQLAFRAGEECFTALTRGSAGNWSLSGLAVGLPAGRYCDVASLTRAFAAGLSACPREVVVGPNGQVLSGIVAQDDLLAIYTGARLPDVLSS